METFKYFLDLIKVFGSSVLSLQRKYFGGLATPLVTITDRYIRFIFTSKWKQNCTKKCNRVNGGSNLRHIVSNVGKYYVCIPLHVTTSVNRKQNRTNKQNFILTEKIVK